MFCPGCALETSDDLKFCRRCGANLRGVREAMTSGATQDKFDWSKTWVADMFLTDEEKERRHFVTAEEKRFNEERKRINEIKGGIITSIVGLGLMIFLYFFLDVVANQKAPDEAEIIRHVWYVGIIPILVGIGIMINGLFISRRLVKLNKELTQNAQQALPPSMAPTPLPDKSTAQMVSEPAPGCGVVEDTTAQFPGETRRSDTRNL
jgi:hypothetical protein